MTRVTGPKDGNAIRIKLDAKGKKYSVKPQDGSSIVLLSIKNNKYSTGKWLNATLSDSVNKFKKVKFLIIDKPQEFNLIAEYPNSDDEELQNKTIQLFDNWWLENEASFISLLYAADSQEFLSFRKNLASKSSYEKIAEINRIAEKNNLNFSIFTWDTWLQACPDYIKEKDKFESAYSSESQLADALTEDAENFTKRHISSTTSEQNLADNLLTSSKKFLQTESPGVYIIGARLGCDFIAYAGDKFKVFEATEHFFIDKEYPNKMRWFQINFERYHKNNQNMQQNSNDTPNVCLNNNQEQKQPVVNNTSNFVNNPFAFHAMMFNSHEKDITASNPLTQVISDNNPTSVKQVIYHLTSHITNLITTSNLSSKQIEDLGLFMATVTQKLCYPSSDSDIHTSNNDYNSNKRNHAVT